MNAPFYLHSSNLIDWNIYRLFKYNLFYVSILFGIFFRQLNHLA